MTTINNLPLLPALRTSDQFVVWAPNQGDSRRVPYNAIKTDILDSFNSDIAATVMTFSNKTFNLVDNNLTGTFGQFNAACSDADFVSVAGLAANTGAAGVGFAQNGTGSVLRTVRDKLNENIVTPADFGALGAEIGQVPPNETSQLSAFFSYLNNNPGIVGRMPKRVYGITAALPNINQSGVKIFGSGLSGVHDVGPIFDCTTIQWLGGVSSATMISIAPSVNGVSGQYLDGIALHGIAFNCASNIAGGVSIKTVRSSLFSLGVANATANGVLLGVVPAADLGEGQDLQTNDFFLTLRQVEGAAASGVALRLQGSATANVSLNRFRMVDVRFADVSAVIEENADNNIWEEFRANCSGSATYSVEWLGGASEPVSCRGEVFYKFSSNRGAIGRGTGTYAYPATNNVILSLDVDNATPAPVYETGASGIYLDSRGFFGGSKGGVLGIQGVFGQSAGDVVNARANLAATTSLLLRNSSEDHMRLETASAGWGVNVDGGGNLRFVRIAGSGIINLPHNAQIGGNVGFQGTSPIAKPIVTGSRAGNAALESLLTALANYGLITNSTTA